MPMFKFRMGDLFDADDPLAIWLCTLSIAFNDAIHATTKYLEAVKAERSWEVLYEWRVQISHFNEACLHLQRGRDVDEVIHFLQAEGLLGEFDDVLSRYDVVRRAANRIRDEATFHYPYKSGQRAVVRALRQLADQEEFFGSYGPSSTIRHSRQLYADQVIATLVMNACGGTLEAHREASDQLQDAIGAFGRFANAVLDAYFVRHSRAPQNVHPVDVDPGRLQ
jgi:hypothetical protein